VSAKSRSNIIPGFEGVSMDQDFIQTDANIIREIVAGRW
jgi:hypothetical protein